MLVERVEKHIIKENNKYYKLLDNYCFKSKNLYNFANYTIRQSFCKDGEYIPYNKLDKILKQNNMDLDYRNMPTADSAQQCLRLLDKNWKSFFRAIKDWSNNKQKYSGKPKLPKYLRKNQRNILILTNNNCKVKNGFVKFPKVFNGFTLKTKVNKIQQVRILPKNKQFIIEIVYKKEVKPQKIDNGRYVSIDLGVNNLATLTNNCNELPIILSGRKIKSINQYYNKQMSHYRQIAKRMNNLNYTNKMNKLTIRRNNLINDLIHKASRKAVNYALSCGANTIVIGYNKNWKRNSKMNKIINQNFIQIPYETLVNQIKYKSENEGINVTITEESYTSGTSFLDGELPIKENYNKNRRIYRGLFVSNKGIKINSDVNGSLQIMRKVFPNAFSYGIEDYGFNPIRVNL